MSASTPEAIAEQHLLRLRGLLQVPRAYYLSQPYVEAVLWALARLGVESETKDSREALQELREAVRSWAKAFAPKATLAELREGARAVRRLADNEEAAAFLRLLELIPDEPEKKGSP